SEVEVPVDLVEGALCQEQGERERGARAQQRVAEVARAEPRRASWCSLRGVAFGDRTHRRTCPGCSRDCCAYGPNVADARAADAGDSGRAWADAIGGGTCRAVFRCSPFMRACTASYIAAAI